MRFLFVFVLCFSIGFCRGYSNCSSIEKPKACGEADCVWFRKKCVPCEEVTRVKSCRRKDQCVYDEVNNTCHTFSRIPTTSPTESPSSAPTLSPIDYTQGKPCQDYKYSKPCNKNRFCVWRKHYGDCCNIEDPDAFCKRHTKSKNCKKFGCNWDKNMKTCH